MGIKLLYFQLSLVKIKSHSGGMFVGYYTDGAVWWATIGREEISS